MDLIFEHRKNMLKIKNIYVYVLGKLWLCFFIFESIIDVYKHCHFINIGNKKQNENSNVGSFVKWDDRKQQLL